MMITRERLQILNERLPMDLALNVVDLYDSEGPTGTRVEVMIPFQTKANQ